jgi:hypothetical protein
MNRKMPRETDHTSAFEIPGGHATEQALALIRDTEGTACVTRLLNNIGN